MKVLLFEFISGGGFAGQCLPVALAQEGIMMLQALVTELKALPGVELIILLDARCHLDGLPERATIHRIDDQQDYRCALKKYLQECDAFWPIAPETGGTLAGLSDFAAQNKIITLLSSLDAIKLCTSKFETNRHLQKFKINAIQTDYYDPEWPTNCETIVVKPDDGVGGEGGTVISSRNELRHFNLSDKGTQYIVQPYLPGRSISLSCLCRNGVGWLLSCNEQQVELMDGCFKLNACRVNIQDVDANGYQQLINRVAKAIPGLWGYIGIDLIESEAFGPVILEINPRITTSFCGLGEAIGVNIAEQVLRLATDDPTLIQGRGKTVTVRIA